MADKKSTRKKRTKLQLGINCSIDEGVPAVFLCSHCKKPYCEDCIGRESAKKTLCLHCAAVDKGKKDEVQRNSKSIKAPKKKTLYITFGILASIGIAINAYILLTNKFETNKSQAFEPNISMQLMGIAECRANLEALAAEAMAYYKTFDRPPYSVDDLSSMLGVTGKTQDPVTLEPYIIENDGKQAITIRCPNPEEHGVASISAVPGKPARVDYSSVGGNP